MDEPILAAVDDSDSASAVLERAVSLATATDSPLHVLTVVEPRGNRLAFGIEEVDDLNTAASALTEHVADANRSVELQAEVRRGRPDDEILAYAAEIDASLLVVGRQGTAGLPRALLGSTADRLARLSPIPVVIVPAADLEGASQSDRSS